MKPQRRINNPKIIDRKLIEEQLRNGDNVIIQFCDNEYSEEILLELNELCYEYDENFSIRFYGDYTTIFDCKVVSKIPNVKSLLIDCITKSKNANFLTNLKNLKTLDLGIYELKETEILNSENWKNLTELSIGLTKTKSFNLEYLTNFKKLKSLTICGHTKNINSISDIKKLEHLVLTSIPKINLSFINSLKKLRTLKIVLGGRENINEIESNNITELEIIRVRGFKDFKNISNFSFLKKLLIEDQIKMEELEFNKGNPDLIDLKLINCKKLKTLSGISNLISLNHIRIYKTDINFNSFVKEQFPNSLKDIDFSTAKVKTDKIIEEKLIKLKYWKH